MKNIGVVKFVKKQGEKVRKVTQVEALQPKTSEGVVYGGQARPHLKELSMAAYQGHI